MRYEVFFVSKNSPETSMGEFPSQADADAYVEGLRIPEGYNVITRPVEAGA